MTPGWRGRDPVVISAFDVMGAHHLLVHSCEDIACAVSDSSAVRPQGQMRSTLTSDSGRWVCGHEVVDRGLDPYHRLLFNPVGHGGVVVINEAAHRLFRAFQRPATFDQARATASESG